MLGPPASAVATAIHNAGQLASQIIDADASAGTTVILTEPTEITDSCDPMGVPVHISDGGGPRWAMPESVSAAR
ncbi:MAG: hypothetical protein M0008_06900 [Actinomycetota bacterium]|nr:hypothetical protein [Actinomycetota bacterium]